MPGFPSSDRAGGDTVTELTEFPGMTVPPGPLILTNEHRLALAYYLNVPQQPGFFETIKRQYQGEIRPIVVVIFDGLDGIRFGYPNDEALHGHRLWGRGLKPYA